MRSPVTPDMRQLGGLAGWHVVFRRAGRRARGHSIPLLAIVIAHIPLLFVCSFCFHPPNAPAELSHITLKQTKNSNPSHHLLNCKSNIFSVSFTGKVRPHREPSAQQDIGWSSPTHPRSGLPPCVPADPESATRALPTLYYAHENCIYRVSIEREYTDCLVTTLAEQHLKISVSKGVAYADTPDAADVHPSGLKRCRVCRQPGYGQTFSFERFRVCGVSAYVVLAVALVDLVPYIIFNMLIVATSDGILYLDTRPSLTIIL